MRCCVVRVCRFDGNARARTHTHTLYTECAQRRARPPPTRMSSRPPPTADEYVADVPRRVNKLRDVYARARATNRAAILRLTIKKHRCDKLSDVGRHVRDTDAYDIPYECVDNEAFCAAFRTLFDVEGTPAGAAVATVVDRVSIEVLHGLADAVMWVLPSLIGTRLSYFKLDVEDPMYDAIVTMRAFPSRLLPFFREWLPTCSRLVELSLPWRLGSEILHGMCAIISGHSDTGRLTEYPARTTLQHLRFGETYGASDTEAALCRVINRLPALVECDMSHIEGEFGASCVPLIECVRAHTSLTDVSFPATWDITRTPIVAPLSLALGELVGKNTRLQRVAVAANSAGRVVANLNRLQPIANGLKANATLLALRISRISYATGSLDCIFDALLRTSAESSNTTLRQLDVSHNGDITPTTVQLLVQLFTTNSTLTDLNISGCGFRSAAMGTFLPAAAEAAADAAAALGPRSEEAADAAARAIGDALARNHGLRVFNLARCFSELHTVYPILDALAQNMGVEEIDCQPRSAEITTAYSGEIVQPTRDRMRRMLDFRPANPCSVTLWPSVTVTFPERERFYYFQRYINVVVRLRIMCQGERAAVIRHAPLDAITWVCMSAPLWVVDMVCKLLRRERHYV